MAERTRGPIVENGTDSDDPWERAMAYVREAWTAETINFDEARDDQRFYAGDQWLPDARLDRENANRPVITINRLPGFIHQVTNDIRKDTPAAKAVPSKDGASEEVAEIFNGMIRSIQDKSNAKAAYVQAVENACVTGLGAFKINTIVSNPMKSSEQEIVFERIVDPFQVVWDPACRKPDKSDARYVFMFHDLPNEVFRKQFPDAAMSSMPTGPVGMTGLIWYAVASTRVAEYWYKKTTKKKVLVLQDDTILPVDEALKITEAGQVLDVKEKRTVEVTEVCMRLMSGSEFLTPESPWAGKYIPIIPVIGEEIYIQGRCIRRGMVRDAKDAQRVYNYMRTAAVEAAALQPKMPWILTKDMIRGLEDHWGEMGRRNLPYAVYNVDKMAPGAKPERAAPALAQGGLDSQAQLAGQDLQAVIGIYNVSLGAPSEETSGRAILARQKQGDTGTYNYVDNLATAVRYAGIILVDLIPKIYDTPRIVRTIGEDGSVDMAQINHPEGPDGQPMPAGMMAHIEPEEMEALKKINDLSVGEYDVTVITGPSFATKRMEAAETLSELATKNPKVMELAGDIILKNMDFPGAEEVAKRWERTIPKNVMEDDLPPPPPPPEMIADVELKTAQAAKARADAQNTEAATVETAVGVISMLQQMHGQIAQLTNTLNAMSAPPGTQDGAPPSSPAMGAPGPAPAPPQPQAGPVPSSQVGELEPMQ